MRSHPRKSLRYQLNRLARRRISFRLRHVDNVSIAIPIHERWSYRVTSEIPSVTGSRMRDPGTCLLFREDLAFCFHGEWAFRPRYFVELFRGRKYGSFFFLFLQFYRFKLRHWQAHDRGFWRFFRGRLAFLWSSWLSTYREKSLASISWVRFFSVFFVTITFVVVQSVVWKIKVRPLVKYFQVSFKRFSANRLRVYVVPFLGKLVCSVAKFSQLIFAVLNLCESLERK